MPRINVNPIKKRKNDRFVETLAIISLIIGLAIILVFVFVFLPIGTHFDFKNFDHDTTSMVGTFIGGVVSPFLNITTIFLIFLTYRTNRDELKALSNFNNVQSFLTNYNGFIEILGKMAKERKGHFSGYCNVYYDNIRKDKALIVKKQEEIRLKYDMANEQERNKANIEVDKKMKEFLIGKMKYKNNRHYLINDFSNGIKECLRFLKLNKKSSQSFYLYEIRLLLDDQYIRQSLIFKACIDDDLNDLMTEFKLLRNQDRSNKLESFNFPLVELGLFIEEAFDE